MTGDAVLAGVHVLRLRSGPQAPCRPPRPSRRHNLDSGVHAALPTSSSKSLPAELFGEGGHSAADSALTPSVRQRADGVVWSVARVRLPKSSPRPLIISVSNCSKCDRDKLTLPEIDSCLPRAHGFTRALCFHQQGRGPPGQEPSGAEEPPGHRPLLKVPLSPGRPISRVPSPRHDRRTVAVAAQESG